MTTWAWKSERHIGGGGFGQVYEASGPVDGRIVAKVVPKADGATREQLIGHDVPQSPHVVPVLHTEETPTSYVLFMPRADYSLREKIGTGMTTGDAIKILMDVAEALKIIAPTVVHRDIKPDNVLYLDNQWALCDFGIARYAEATTAQDTRKYSLTAPNAAPEQWRSERATSATDVYAFGVVAYELLSGTRPFVGTVDELREQHLNVAPALLPGNKKLAWLISECLSKAPESRPTPANLLDRLTRADTEGATRGGSALAAAQSAVLSERAEREAAAEAARTEHERRESLLASCEVGFSALVEELVEFIGDSAPATTVHRGGDGTVELSLGAAQLTISGPRPNATRGTSFDVIAYGEVRLTGKTSSRSHSLYYANFSGDGKYAWFELGFTHRFAADFSNDPHAVPPDLGLGAFSNGGGMLQLGYGIAHLDIGDLDQFVDAWAERFGKAASNQFPRPSQLPEGPLQYPPRR